MTTKLPLHLEAIAQRIDAVGTLRVTSSNACVTRVLCSLGLAETSTDALGWPVVRLTADGQCDLSTLTNQRRSKGLRDYSSICRHKGLTSATIAVTTDS